jgi:hypothetical protein
MTATTDIHNPAPDNLADHLDMAKPATPAQMFGGKP